MTDAPLNRSAFVEWLLIAAVTVAFFDEAVRKILPSHPLAITAVKDGMVYVAGAIIMVTWSAVLSRYLVWFVPWLFLTGVGALITGLRYNAPLATLAIVRTYCCIP